MTRRFAMATICVLVNAAWWTMLRNHDHLVISVSLFGVQSFEAHFVVCNRNLRQNSVAWPVSKIFAVPLLLDSLDHSTLLPTDRPTIPRLLPVFWPSLNVVSVTVP